MQQSHSNNPNNKNSHQEQHNNEGSDNPVDSRDSPEDIKPAKQLQSSVSVSLQRPHEIQTSQNKSLSPVNRKDAENFTRDDLGNKFGPVSLMPSSQMPSQSKGASLKDSMQPMIGHGPIDLSGTGTAYGQSLLHNIGSSFDPQKGNIYSSGNIQTKHQDLMSSSFVNDSQIGAQHSKQLQTELPYSQNPSLSKQGLSTQQVQVAETYLQQPSEPSLNQEVQRKPSLQRANRHNLFGNNKVKSSSLSSSKSDNSSQHDAYLRQPMINDKLNNTMPNRTSLQPNYSIIPKNSLTWRDSDSGQQYDEPQDEISSSKTISVSEVDEEDMRILSNALKKEHGSKGSEELEEEKHASLSQATSGTQKPRQNFEQKIQAIRKLQREDPNIYREWSPRRKEDRSNRGNWSKSEDEQLIQAVSKYGERDWKMISEYVNERTPQQCRQRWFEALNPDLVKGKWTHQEDQKLLKAVRKHDGNWQRIAEVVKSRTNKQCLQRWHEVLKPDLIKGTWTSAEDQELTNAVIKYGSRNWQKIAENVEGRTNKQCLQRWKVALRTELARDNWAKEDDEQLSYSVNKYGEDWPKIAKRMNRKSKSGRSLIQCLHRWKTVHNPSFDGSSKGKWTLQEDEQLVIAMSNWNGKNWSYIAQAVESRDENECFSRWYEKIKPAISRMSWDEPSDTLLDQQVARHEVSNWEQIAEGIEQHTPLQCMLRYYEKLNPDLIKGSKGAWTFEEDEKLRNAVETFNAKDWKKIAQCVEGRSIQQCHQRWHGKLNPTVTKGQWTEEEDQKLCMAVSKYGDRDWKKVSECVPGRSKKLCHQRWEIILNPDIVKGHWTHEEDNKLTIAVQKFGEGNWNRIAEFVEGRTNKQCRYRWHDVVYLRLSRGGRTNWTKQEDEKLIVAVEKFGKGNWMKIAQQIEGRTNKQCLYRWRQIENRTVAERDKLNSHWTTKQDEKLIYLVKKLGAQKWTQIADHFPGKKGKSCRERWHNHLDPSIKKSSWTLEEELILYLQNREQTNKWAELSKILKGRTDNTIKNHWNSIMKTKSSEMMTETEKRFKKYCLENNVAFQGLPLVQNVEFTSEYKQHFAVFEKSLLHELIDVVSMQNAVYYQMKGLDRGMSQQEPSYDQIEITNSELSRQQRQIYYTQPFNQPSSLSDASSAKERQDDVITNTLRIPMVGQGQKLAQKILKIDDQQEKMVADIKFGLEQDKIQNNMLNLQVHVPPNQDHQTLNFSFYEEQQKDVEHEEKNIKPMPISSESNIKIELTKRTYQQSQTGK